MKQMMFSNGAVVPAVGMGSWNLGQGRHAAREEEAALQLGLDLGMSLIDTAEMYGDGKSEELIGRVIKGCRDKVYLVSKAYPWHVNRLMIERAIHGSLKRLGTEQLDLYLLHWRTGSMLSEVIESFEKLVSQGKIRTWGVSNFDIDDMQKLDGKTGGAACGTNQVLYNVGSRGVEFSLMPWMAQQAMPMMAYSPLGSGNKLLHDPTLARLASKHAVSPATIALAWSIRTGAVVAIPESGDAAHIRENAKALTLQLDQEDLLAIDQQFPAPTKKMSLETL